MTLLPQLRGVRSGDDETFNLPKIAQGLDLEAWLERTKEIVMILTSVEFMSGIKLTSTHNILGITNHSPERMISHSLNQSLS